MLVVKIFAPLREADSGKSFFVESGMVAPAQVTVAAIDERRGKPVGRKISAPDFGHVARQFTRRRVVFAAQGANRAQLSLCGGGWNSFRKHAHRLGILLWILVASHNIVIQHGLNLPALLPRHLREVLAAIESLLFARDGKKNHGCGKFKFAEYARALQGNGRAAAVVIGAGSRFCGIQIVAVAGVIVAGHQHNAVIALRIRAPQNGVDIRNLGGLGDSLALRLDKRIELYVKAAPAVLRVAFEFALDPITGGGNAAAARSRLRGRERAAVAEFHQHLDGMANAGG